MSNRYVYSLCPKAYILKESHTRLVPWQSQSLFDDDLSCKVGFIPTYLL